MKYTRTNTSVFNLCYHIIFTPKYRKPLLKYVNEHYLIRLFKIKAIQIRCLIENIEIMPDHVHIFLRCTQQHLAIPKIMQFLKGYSSYMIRKKYTFMKKYKHLWAPSYFIESIGNISERTIKKYIDNQKINVKTNYKYKYLIKSDIKNIKSDSKNIKSDTKNIKSDSKNIKSDTKNIKVNIY